MIEVFTKNECKLIKNFYRNVNWEEYVNNFNYKYVKIEEAWINERIKNVVENKKNISLDNKQHTILIKLIKGQRLSTHTFNYSNTNSILKNNIFTFVTVINNSYNGGNISYNGLKINYPIGFGIIYERDDIQKISEVINGEILLIFSHFLKINKSKII
jgi:hypothetical protein